MCKKIIIQEIIDIFWMKYFIWCLWSILFIFRCCLKKHLFGSEKQEEKEKKRANQNITMSLKNI